MAGSNSRCSIPIHDSRCFLPIHIYEVTTGNPVAWPALLEELVHVRLFEVSPSQAAIAPSTTACSTLLEAASRACMARPFTTVA
jgi:hypothetical protein